MKQENVWMVKYRSACIFSLLLIHFLCLSGRSFAQVDSTAVDSVELVIPRLNTEEGMNDSIVNQKAPTLSSVALVFDYGKLVGLVLKTESKYEAGVQFEFFNKLQLVGEFGIATLAPNDVYVNANYVSKGSYWRVGLGYKIDMSPKYNFMFGVRYGQSTFSDGGEIQIVSNSGLYDTYLEPFDRDNLSAHWYELVMSSERRVWKGLYLGFHARLRVMGGYDEQVPLDVFSIPGYGRTIDKSVPAINLYIKYALELF